MKIIDENKIQQLMGVRSCRSEIQEILLKAEEMKGLNLRDCAKLLSIQEPELLEQLFNSAEKIKQAIYGPRIVLFAPFYGSNFCVNDCEYCAFHCRNKSPRKKLTPEEIKEEVQTLENMGHKRLLLEFGEHPVENTIDYIVDVINAIYGVKSGQGEIRRVNINIAPTTVDNYRRLKEAGIGTYQLFQETYHRPTYNKLHCGPKADYDRQITALDKAFAGGIDDLGIGVLFGLFDYRFEVLSLMQYIEYMDKTFGVGPHTISIPRFQKAHTVAFKPNYAVSDNDFLKIVAILRLAVPYTGIIISTRERPEIRQKAFAVGVSQASAASKTQPGGYKKAANGEEIEAQFNLNDHRSLGEVVQDICRLGYLPSFCTSCYRLGRTGDIFMQLAKSGKIQNMCQPNALITFKEYLLDYADPQTRAVGEQTILKFLQEIKNPATRNILANNLAKLDRGERDLQI